MTNCYLQVCYLEMRLHHLNITCANISTAKRKLQNLYGFQNYGLFKDKLWCDDTTVLKQNNIYLTMKEKENVLFDTIDDIAFCVDSVTQSCTSVVQNGGTVLEGPCIIDCIGRKTSAAPYQQLSKCNCDNTVCENFIEMAVIKSPVGNLQHTILNKSNYTCEFLPGFVPCDNANDCPTSSLDRIDHIALAVPCGSAMQYMNWYTTNMRLLRFKTSVRENTSGLVIRAQRGNGVRLLTLVEHPCSENVVVSKEFEMCNDQVKFVFCESLFDEGCDQIQTFLRCHGGAGVQHVAFHTSHILHDAQCWVDRGVSFIMPPPAYYTEIKATLEKLRLQLNLNDICDKGILIDAEKHEDNQTNEDGYLYQVFTKPVLDSNTFFFELIQRDKARGFGEGNVSALWRALDAHLQAISPASETS